MEWGAIAYLTQSKYGRCTDGTCTEVWINNVNTGTGEENNGIKWGPSITGCSGISVSAEVKNNMTSCEEGRDYKQAGVNASTTGNIYGIYDMSGGTWDKTMGVLMDEKGTPIYSSSGFNSDTMPESKYYDKYELTTGNYDFSKGKLGDATREKLKALNGIRGWYGDHSIMPYASVFWFSRGSDVPSGSNAGIFSFSYDTGGAWTNYGSRVVVVTE